MEAPIVLKSLLEHLAHLNPVVFAVSDPTIAKYRAMAGIAGAHSCSRHHAEKLITALLYRPSDEQQLVRTWGVKRMEVQAWLAQGLAGSDSIVINNDVLGENLRDAIFQATGVCLKTDKTLEGYARELSQRLGKPIKFHKRIEYKAELATIFARMAVEKRYSKRQSGYETAFKRWGYVPDAQIATA